MNNNIELKENRNFWLSLKKPFFVLAPMEEVTDVAFREMFARYSGSEQSDKSENRTNSFVMFTEFVNVDGLTHPEGYKKLSLDLDYTENQRPMVAQIWGTNPEKFFEAAQIIVKLGFDGIDINMGCPQDKEIGIGACAALIRTPELASQIIEATIKGAGDLPVSVKTRIGYSKADEMEAWVIQLLKHDIAALTLHARTKQEKSKVPAQWEKIAEAVQLRNKAQGARPKEDRTLIIGNGDVKSRAEGLERAKQTDCDGVMIARGAFGNPWLFREDNYEPTIKERLSVMLEHAQLFNQKLGAHKSFVIMRKHFKAYASGFDGAAELRAKLMETKNLEEVEKIVTDAIR
jgi:nifR3 family TIM-barrel protein